MTDFLVLQYIPTVFFSVPRSKITLFCVLKFLLDFSIPYTDHMWRLNNFLSLFFIIQGRVLYITWVYSMVESKVGYRRAFKRLGLAWFVFGEVSASRILSLWLVLEPITFRSQIRAASNIYSNRKEYMSSVTARNANYRLRGGTTAQGRKWQVHSSSCPSFVARSGWQKRRGRDVHTCSAVFIVCNV